MCLKYNSYQKKKDSPLYIFELTQSLKSIYSYFGLSVQFYWRAAST
jgi:hypothetical protein